MKFNKQLDVGVIAFVMDSDFWCRAGVMAVFCLALFVLVFNRVAHRGFINEETAAGRVVAALSRKIPARTMWVVMRYPGFVLLGLVLGWVIESRSSSHVIAMQRFLVADSRSKGLSPAVALVVAERETNGFEVALNVKVTEGIGTGYRFYPLGAVATFNQAISNWSLIDWREDGLHVGRSSNAYFVPRMELQAGGR